MVGRPPFFCFFYKIFLVFVLTCLVGGRIVLSREAPADPWVTRKTFLPDTSPETAEMRALTTDRRGDVRISSSYRAVICDTRGRVLARGRTTNISENGAFVVGIARHGPPRGKQVIVEMEIPFAGLRHGRRGGFRRVRYSARLVHTQALGSMFGAGLELLDKLA